MLNSSLTVALGTSLCIAASLQSIHQSQTHLSTEQQRRGEVRLQIEETTQRSELSPLDTFKQNHPAARFYGQPFYTGAEQNDEAIGGGMVYGTSLAEGSSPWESATNFVNEIQDVLGDNVGNLMPAQAIALGEEAVQGVMYDKHTGKHRFSTFRFEQSFSGIPVFRSGIGFLVRNQDNYPVVTAGVQVRDLSGFSVAAGAAAEVTPTMLANVRRLMESATAAEQENPRMKSVLTRQAREAARLQTYDQELVIFAGTGDVPSDPKLAVSFIAKRGSVKTVPDYQKYLVLAEVSSGEILYSETRIHNCNCSSCLDVFGNVSGRATQGLATLECDPEFAVPLPYAQVTIEGGNTTFADANGDFTLPHGGDTSVNVTSSLSGQYFVVNDQSAAGSTPTVSQSVTPPGPVDFLHNPVNNQDLMTANVNAYVESNLIRDYVLSYEPTFPVINSQTFFDVNTNIGSSCNAFYDGVSINFYQEGGGCNNTSFSDVIYHEYGHHLINVTNNGQGQMGEGSGDAIGVLIQDEPILGQGFTGSCGTGIRTADNTHQYPCSGAIHNCGQLISGCVWDTRNELMVTEPSSYKDIGASLFLGMLVARGQLTPGNNTIEPDITILYLQLDDDDAEIGNGTPHYAEISAGFGAHNMDAPALDLLEFDYPGGRPTLVNPLGGVQFTVQINPLLKTPQPGTGILHLDRGNGFEQFPMSEIAANLYQANFPPIDCGSIVSYFVSAQTNDGDAELDPDGVPYSSFSAISGAGLEDVLIDDFQTDQGWSFSGDATDGQWEIGNPLGGGDRGDPADDADGSGNCLLTDNADGNSDVDGGSTIATSPVYDPGVTGSEEFLISYQRWYSNNVGNSPEADIFVVDISNDGGSTWTNLETVGPTGADVRGGWITRTFRVSDFVTPTNQMRLRFNASDLGAGSVVEAGIDDLRIQRVDCLEQLGPLSIGVVKGSLTSGGLPELQESDDQLAMLEPIFQQFRWQLIFDVQTQTSSQNPSAMEFHLESRTFNVVGTIRQSISLYNYDTGQFDEVDVATAAGSDTVTTVPIGGDISRYVENATGNMRARIFYQNDIPYWVFNFANIFLPFDTFVDQIFWTVQP